MKLVKTNERWNRTFDTEGTESGNRLESVQFNIVDADDNQAGYVNVYEGHADMGYENLNININGFGSVEEGIAKIKEMFGFE